MVLDHTFMDLQKFCIQVCSTCKHAQLQSYDFGYFYLPSSSKWDPHRFSHRNWKKLLIHIFPRSFDKTNNLKALLFLAQPPGSMHYYQWKTGCHLDINFILKESSKLDRQYNVSFIVVSSNFTPPPGISFKRLKFCMKCKALISHILLFLFFSQ